LAAFVLVAIAVPGVALAATIVGFSASGELTQKDAGDSVLTVSAGLPGGFPDGIPGRLTTDQRFTGKLTNASWDELAKAKVDVNPHNSFVTFADGVLDFAGGQEAIVGVAFGDIDVHKGKNRLIGSYVAASPA
jgi:hypothetical protein